MKLKYYILLLLLSVAACKIYSQNQRKIYSVTIFKWLKNEDAEIKQFVKIDSTGTVYFANKDTGEKVNLKSFEKSINNFILEKNVEKVTGNDDPPRVASVPKNGEQNVYITVTFLDDFHNESQLSTITNYSSKQEKLKITNKEYLLYNYLDKNDLNILKALLK